MLNPHVQFRAMELAWDEDNPQQDPPDEPEDDRHDKLANSCINPVYGPAYPLRDPLPDFANDVGHPRPGHADDFRDPHQRVAEPAARRPVAARAIAPVRGLGALLVAVVTGLDA